MNLTPDRPHSREQPNPNGKWRSWPGKRRWLRTLLLASAYLFGPLQTFAASDENAAYLIQEHPTIKCWRSNQLLADRTDRALLANDRLELSPKAIGHIIFANSVVTLVGPTNYTVPAIKQLRTKAAETQTRKVPGTRSGTLEAPIEDIFKLNSLPALVHKQPAIQRDAGRLGNRFARSQVSNSSPRIYSPVGVMTHVDPLLLWNESNPEFDRFSIEEIMTPSPYQPITPVENGYFFRGTEVAPGKRLSEYYPTPPTLEQGTFYRLSLWQEGTDVVRDGDSVIFQVDPGNPPNGLSAEPARLLASILALLGEDTFRPGEALARLHGLPSRFANSELALRLKYFVYVREGLLEEADAVAALLLKR